MDTFDFSPRRAIVTGSDSGIGRATAVALADAGLDVGVTWHTDEEGAEQTAAAVRERGRRAEVTTSGRLAPRVRHLAEGMTT
jgi:NAD(P)-dependent dehydrogenase (short-subunit alcohol dehydrogenase family)